MAYNIKKNESFGRENAGRIHVQALPMPIIMWCTNMESATCHQSMVPEMSTLKKFNMTFIYINEISLNGWLKWTYVYKITMSS